MIGLTSRQAALLHYLERHPGASIEEMGRALGYSPNCKAIISYHLKGLEERGAIRRLKRRARSVEVLCPPPKPELRVVYGPGHWGDRARLKRAEYARAGAET
jgi:SOS-response transcriptional repressor LexA